MNRIILIFAAVTAATLLLVGTFVTAAGMLGADLHELPLVGGLFPAPVEASLDPELNELNTSVEEQVESDLRSPGQVIDNSASPLHAFLLPSPWNSDQLEDLETQLRNRLNALTEAEKDLERRKADLEESQRHLNELQVELESIRSGLIAERDETTALEDEVRLKAEAEADKRVSSLKQMATIFADGDPDETATMMMGIYTPADIGVILSGMSPEKVQPLMQSINTIGADPDLLAKVAAAYQAELAKQAE
ncbi:MAG: hypothetical protein KDB61_08150 [Planctomycetes bacterium]|nr:hypothetical protein [Planctomycetota bacterium]